MRGTGDNARRAEAEALVSLAREAGVVLLGYFRRGALPHLKKAGRANIVTEADLASQELILTGLARIFPGIPAVGEEGRTGEEPLEGPYFLVDPLDGTLNFLHGIPFFGVSIALMEGGEPVVGVVHAPALGETFHAVRGGGAFLNGERIETRGHVPIREAVAVTGWPYDPKLLPWAQRALAAIQARVREVRILGAASLEMCYVAAGFIDIYWEVGLYPWDLAAGWLVVEEAGGVVGDEDGGRFRLYLGRVVAGRSRGLVDEAVRALRSL
ncbi:inositol monophosphatase [Candidatus Bipolaricaulota bacterium]|nr:inositol monophosphatase [Candidatus Bipolaricaulota bacterium]